MISIILVGDNQRQIAKFVEKYNGQVITIKTEGIEYSIKEIREITREANIYHKELRIYLLPDFHRSSLEAQNAFLKLLEEPPSNTQFILTVPNIYLLLPTIISRAKVINLARPEVICHGGSTSGKKSLLLTGQLITSDSKEATLTILQELIILLRKELALNTHNPLILKEVINVKQLIENNNINHQLALDHLLIFIYNCYNGYNNYKNYKNEKSLHSH